MGLFNPISGQYERLRRAMDDRKTVGLKEAADAMKVKQENVDNSLMIMGKRRLFGNQKPYVDDELHLVVLDKRYAGYASVMSAVERLTERLEEARIMPRKLSNRLTRDKQASHSSPVGGFFRDLADHYVSGDSGSESFKKAARTLLHENDASTPEDKRRLDTQEAEEILVELLQNTNGLRSMLLAYPDKHYPQTLADWLNALNNTVQAWEGCLEAAGGKKEKSAAMVRTEEKLKRQFLPDFARKLAELEEPAEDHNPKTPAMKDIEGCIGDLRILKKKMRSLEMNLALDRIIDILQGIRSSLNDESLPFNRSAVNSLRNCYLPMVKELSSQYMKYETIQNPGTATVKAMNETQRVLGMDVPVALQKLLTDMRTGAAINLEAQATALKRKLQMDGLLN